MRKVVCILKVWLKAVWMRCKNAMYAIVGTIDLPCIPFSVLAG